MIRRTRGQEITLRSETSLSSCSTISAEEGLASYSWILVSANDSFPGAPEFAVEVGRDPRVLVIPSYRLGYAGSSYQFQLKTTFGDGELAGTANATGKSPIISSRSGSKASGVHQGSQFRCHGPIAAEGSPRANVVGSASKEHASR